MDLSSDDARSIAADTAANPLLHEASLHPESLAQQRRGDIPPQAPVILFWPAGGSVLVALHVGGIVDAGGSSELSSLSTTRTRYVAAVRPATETLPRVFADGLVPKRQIGCARFRQRDKEPC